MNQGDLYKGDPTIRQGEDGHWYHYPDKGGPKLVFLIASILIVLLGFWLSWDPGVRWLFGERETARITRIVMEEPGIDPVIFRYRKTIPEGDHLTYFSYTASIEEEDGSTKDFQLAVGSRRTAFSNVNDLVEIIYFEGESHAYELLEHRTWSFGLGFLCIGTVLTACAIPTLLAVGRPIRIDPESQEALAAADHS
ncbi:hypothetical protein [Pelagicoccus mobilis]|uniref:DUF3592 domain-containing protein n=1 Tax=Pelagicoccus mobilis TaxID=415221 RepID=A0A934VTP8_9BACT|nr:hypothetical protein [Pelagicoccus mobilis]MBK1879739.1 hypothetical protein [Pelagicoccus mobilis]